MFELLQPRLDYLLFTGAVVAFFVGLAWWLPKSRAYARLPRRTWLLVAIVLAGGAWLTERAGEHERRKIEELVEVMAPTYAQEMARLGHARVTTATPADDPLYAALIEAEIGWLRVNPHVHDIYTMRRNAEGAAVFIVDSETDYNGNGRIDEEREERTDIGEVYDEEDAGMDRAFAGEANFNPEIVHDRWGSWVGAWAPIFDAAGKVEAVVGLDFDARWWVRAIRAARGERILQVALLLLAIAGGVAANGYIAGDLSERRDAERQLREAQERMNLTVQQMPLAFIEWNRAGQVVAWNPAAERIFGYQREEALGRHFEMLVPPKARDEIHRIWADLIGQGGDQHSVNENVTKAGRVITCEWFNTRLIDRTGEVVAVMSLTQDLTERRSLEAQVNQAQKMQSIGMLAAGIAHDFNNILTIIHGHSDLLLDRHDLDPDAIEDITRIGQAAERAAHLTRQLLSFSRRQAMFARPLNLNDTVTASASMLRRVLGEHIALHCDLASDLPLVEADSNLLEQVITNLAVNARDAMPGGGDLTLATRVVEISPDEAQRHPEANPCTAVCLRVRDTGSGIDPEKLPHIFEPFYTTKEVGKGTGLGLAAVHGIVKQHRGWLTIASELEKGTTLEIFLPATTKTLPAATVPLPANGAGKGSAGACTVLLVEDETSVRMVARAALERDGFRVIEAGDGVAALEIWAKRRGEIDLLLTDMVMPRGVSGRDLAAQCLADKPGLGVIFSSGYSIELAAPDFVETERQRYLQKPYAPQVLLATARALAAGRGI